MQTDCISEVVFGTKTTGPPQQWGPVKTRACLVSPYGRDFMQTSSHISAQIRISITSTCRLFLLPQRYETLGLGVGRGKPLASLKRVKFFNNLYLSIVGPTISVVLRLSTFCLANVVIC